MLEDEDDAAYRFLAKKYGERIEVKNTKELYTKLKEVYSQTEKLQSAAEREGYMESPYKNFAARSDIDRLAVMYCFGGWYFDVDVMPKEPLPKNKEVEYGFQFYRNPAGTLSNNNIFAAIPNASINKSYLDEVCSHYDCIDPHKPGEHTLLDKKYTSFEFYEEVLHGKRHNDVKTETKFSISGRSGPLHITPRRLFTVLLTGPGLIVETTKSACGDDKRAYDKFNAQRYSDGHYEAPPKAITVFSVSLLGGRFLSHS